MLSMWLAMKIVLFVIAVEALAELLTDSKLFQPLKNRILDWRKECLADGEQTIVRLNQFLSWLLASWFDCAYCFSYPIAMGFALFLNVELTDYGIINWLMTTLILARLANWSHDFMRAITGGRQWYLNITHQYEQVNQDVGPAQQQLGQQSESVTPS